jgi:hypothetical protein
MITSSTIRFKNTSSFERGVRALKEERINFEFSSSKLSVDLCDSDLEAAVHELDCPHLGKLDFEVVA